MIPDYLPHPEQIHPLVAKRSSTVYSIQSVRSYNFSSYEADDERSSGDESVCPELDGQSDCLTQRHERDKLTISSRKELVGWYMYSFAAEVFIICGIGTFIPITLEQLARENGVLQSDNTTPCGSNSFHSSGKPSSSGSDSTKTCLVYILGIPVNTASFAMYTFSISVLIEALLVISISGAANYGKI
ncbi:Autophagy-related protein 22 [Golovinomyces cichoracearum]|uniref:Autophagy-related protein n=1 Tax=Golovinomyces cichoracearum TaxID=62708 RepID=A0A420JAW7_9PEZI|nr:Autophagy-related protein 22 [Golovinomyces cichoracearum]